MDLHTFERLGRERQHVLLSEAAELRQTHILQGGRLVRPSPLRLALAHWLRVWAQHLDHQGTPETAPDPGC